MTRRTTATLLVLLTLLALAARVGAIVYLKAWERPNAMEHKAIALSLIHGTGFSFGDWSYFGPTSVQSPTFPFLLAGMYKIFGDDAAGAYIAIMMMNAALGAAMVWLTYLLARTLGATALTGLLAAAAVAIWPSQVYAASAVQAIALITCCIAACIVLFYRAVRTGRLGPWIGYSIVGTFGALTEPVVLPALAITGLLVLAWRDLAWRIRLRNAAVLLITTFVVLGPWCVRNYIVHGQLIPVKGSFWVNVWKGNNEYATGTDRLALTPQERAKARAKGDSFEDDMADTAHQYDMLDPSQKSRLRHQPEVVRERVFKEFATDWIAHNRGRYAELCSIRLFKTLTVDWDNPRSYNTVYIVSRFTLAVMSLIGLFVAWRLRWSLLIPGVFVGAALLTYALTVTAARFGLPFEPIQLCLACAAITVFFERRGQTTPGFEVVGSTQDSSVEQNADPGRREYAPNPA
jgi:4-amino-4-deoxy-L-arabinose transferase-like glycosyltransferase